MDIVRPRCAGIDIGKRSLTACAITTDARGAQVKEIRTFGTLTGKLLALDN
jgi:transposase